MGATRQSITDVVELQKNHWEPSRMGMTREKTSGQKKARAAARTRARMLITRVQDGVSDPWAGLSNDARALTALLEFAAAGPGRRSCPCYRAGGAHRHAARR